MRGSARLWAKRASTPQSPMRHRAAGRRPDPRRDWRDPYTYTELSRDTQGEYAYL